MIGNPQVSVVIPTRNRPAHLRCSVRSALMQRDVDIEIIVVDDASDDEGEVHAALAELDDPRLHVMRLPVRGGASAARNAGIEHARGIWIAFLDDDDLWSPNKLQLQLERAKAERAGFVYGSAVYIDADCRIVHYAPAPHPEDLERRILSHNPVPGGGSNPIALASLVRENGGFDTELPALQDWDCWIRLARTGRVAACSEILLAYRIHAHTMSANREIDKLKALSHLEDKYRAMHSAKDTIVNTERFIDWVGRYQRVLVEYQRASGDRWGAARTYVHLARLERSPQHILRAGAAVLGEPALRAGASIKGVLRRTAAEQELPDEPDWLAVFRDSGMPDTTADTR